MILAGVDDFLLVLVKVGGSTAVLRSHLGKFSST